MTTFRVWCLYTVVICSMIRTDIPYIPLLDLLRNSNFLYFFIYIDDGEAGWYRAPASVFSLRVHDVPDGAAPGPGHVGHPSSRYGKLRNDLNTRAVKARLI
jgi:hypothetical protein